MKRFRQIIAAVITAALIVTIALTIVSCGDNMNYFTKFSGKKFALDSDRFFNGYGTYNNGVAKSGPEMERLTSVTPSEKQLDYLEMEYYNFVHFGMNTFTGVEWGTGKESPSQFNPTGNIDTDQWCEVLKQSGSKGIIITAKHHDGFCLWQTDTTEHSIKNSPYQNGNGDVVKALSESCKKAGLKLGIYLSPWDMNADSYGHVNGCGHSINGNYRDYNDLFVAQLTELLDGRYGEIFSVWFDGAGKDDERREPGFEYDYKRWYEVVKALQPKAVTCIEGEDVRWVGNEAGVSRENEWSVVSRGNTASDNYQTNEKDGEALKAVKYDDTDLGSRELLANYKNLIFFPAEVDVSIHQGWFYHDDQQPKKLEHLLKIYFKSVGGNSSLLLNVPPDKNGRIAERDVNRLKEFGDAVRATTANKQMPNRVVIGDAFVKQAVPELSGLLTDERYTNYTFKPTEYILDFNFDSAFKLKRFDIREDMRYSHRIEYFDLYALVKGKWVLMTEATNVGNRKILIFNEKKIPAASTYRLVIKQARLNPVIRSVQFYS